MDGKSKTNQQNKQKQKTPTLKLVLYFETRAELRGEGNAFIWEQLSVYDYDS